MSEQALTEDERELLRLLLALADSQHREDIVAEERAATAAVLAHFRSSLAEAWADGVSAAEDYCGADCYPVCKDNPWAKSGVEKR